MSAKRYVKVIPRNFRNKRDKLSAKKMEKLLNWYIHEHIDEIRESALNSIMEIVDWDNLNI